MSDFPSATVSAQSQFPPVNALFHFRLKPLETQGLS
jgi:hypothetical protein